MLKPYEMYAKIYYGEKIRPLVNEALNSDEVITAGRRLQLVNEISRDLYDNESSAIKQEILQKIEDSKKSLGDHEDESETRTPDQYLQYVFISY